MRATTFVALILTANLSMTAGRTADTAPPSSIQIKDVTACLQVTDTVARLTCFDRSAAKLKAATEGHDMVVIDRAKVVELQHPHSPPHDKADSSTEQRKFVDIEGKIASARSLGDGQWSFSLDDGSSWATIEAPNSPPHEGDKIHVRRATLGSFFANINGQRAVRVHRSD